MIRRFIFLLPLAVLSSHLGATNLSPELTQAIPDIVLDSGGPTFTLDPAMHIHDPDVPGTAVRMTFRIGEEMKPVHIALFDDETPKTVANFRHYIESGAFSSSFIHRAVPGFVIQGGGFRFTGPSTFANVPAIDPVPNEPGISNVRGTIAMAKVGGDPDSATSQWFINLDDNSANLDEQNDGFTAFGHVLGTGMSVADEVAGLPVYNASDLHPAWTSVPLNNFSDPLSRAHFVETDMEIIPALVFSASSADSDLVNAAIVDGQLQLIPSNDRFGSTTVTVTATDLQGAELRVDTEVSVMDTFSSWRDRRSFPSAEESNSDADPDGDGWPNLLEFAFGGDPVAAGQPHYSPESEAAGDLTFGHLRYARLNYTAWRSSDLQNWIPVWSTGDGFDHDAVVSHAEDAGFLKVTIRPPDDPEPPAQQFWRVSVEIVE